MLFTRFLRLNNFSIIINYYGMSNYRHLIIIAIHSCKNVVYYIPSNELKKDTTEGAPPNLDLCSQNLGEKVFSEPCS